VCSRFRTNNDQVFEKLLAAGLPGFNQNDWLSTIRHEAKVHEKYKEMPDMSPNLPAGSRAEPADIVYADPNGDFIKFLETQDCVGLEPCIKTSSTSNRKYFIEVKTTTQNCDAVFHMSKAQHLRVSLILYSFPGTAMADRDIFRCSRCERRPSPPSMTCTSSAVCTISSQATSKCASMSVREETKPGMVRGRIILGMCLQGLPASLDSRRSQYSSSQARVMR
jgi:hypothetical protein